MKCGEATRSRLKLRPYRVEYGVSVDLDSVGLRGSVANERRRRGVAKNDDTLIRQLTWKSEPNGRDAAQMGGRSGWSRGSRMTTGWADKAFEECAKSVLYGVVVPSVRSACPIQI